MNTRFRRVTLARNLMRMVLWAMLLLGNFGQRAMAAALTWDNGSGDFLWSNSSGSIDWSGSAWSDGSDAVFAANGIGAVNLGSNINANSVTFNNPGFTIAGSNTLSVNAGGITANANASINAPIAALREPDVGRSHRFHAKRCGQYLRRLRHHRGPAT